MLGGVKDRALPELAAPIVEELTSQLTEAREKMTRYRGRKLVKTIMQMRTERVCPSFCSLNLA